MKITALRVESKQINKSGILKFSLLLFVVCTFYFFVGCPFYKTTGVPCPGCGMTRAYKALLTGHFFEAFHWHPLYLVTPPFFLLLYLRDFKIFYNKIINTVFISFFFAVIILTYIIRMIYMFPSESPMVFNRDSIVGILFF